MTNLSIDSAKPVASVPRADTADRVRAAGTGSSEPSASDTPARPSTVVNLNSSTRQAALNSLTYGNLRGHASARPATSDDANRQEQTGRSERKANQDHTARQAVERESAERRITERQGDQAAQAIRAASQSVAAEGVA